MGKLWQMQEFNQIFCLKIIFSSEVEFSDSITDGFLEHVRYQIKSLEAQQNTTHSEKGPGNARKVEKEKKYAKKKKF